MPHIGPAIAVGTLGVIGLLTYPTLGEAVVAGFGSCLFREGPDLPE
jgi:hypothetical protein